MEIGFFQLENLVLSRTPFLFVDAREDRSVELPKELAACVVHAEPVAGADLVMFLNKRAGSKDGAILVISETARSSEELRAKLEVEGYNNVYILAGGLEGLLSEL